ncbi:helix-turn-helix domain-containing protein [Allokutzneria sp. NRRL B-24872]|uniref:winged helix-turn-helix transcriptional regulator n=1 Tax=Allokutzneria sp. NRRL B-24872 TaxID=1137961 RepID=UPI000A395119|nr:winged helix-turn-helix transcriptional regulator [Allokutzneria sp. NRRL B-24872]
MAGDFWSGVTDAAHKLRGEWVPAVLAALADGRPHRFTELATTMRDNEKRRGGRVLHDAVLVRTLERMEINGLVARVERPGAFSRVVTYQLTDEGKSLIAALGPIGDWARRA